jgi:hypothetical protein
MAFWERPTPALADRGTPQVGACDPTSAAASFILPLRTASARPSRHPEPVEGCTTWCACRPPCTALHTGDVGYMPAREYAAKVVSRTRRCPAGLSLRQRASLDAPLTGREMGQMAHLISASALTARLVGRSRAGASRRTMSLRTSGLTWRRLAGTKPAVRFRDKLAKDMTPAQIAEAQKLAREWKPK